MLKIANGAVNEEKVAAILKRGPNWALVLDSGHEIVISDADAKALLPEEPPAPAPEAEKPAKK